MSAGTDLARAAQLTKFLNGVCAGKTLVTSANFELFLEAIYSSTDPSACLNNLLKRDQIGLNTLQRCLRFSDSPGFFNGPVSQLCRFLSDPDLAIIRDGAFLGKVVAKMIEPSIFWDALVEAFDDGKLAAGGEEAIAWLMLQVATLPLADVEDLEPFLEVTQDQSRIEKLRQSSSDVAKGFAYRLMHANGSSEPAGPVDQRGPGGRHDNDHPDYRDIHILPTADELRSVEPPFLRTASYLIDPDVPDRTKLHLDNQFRLLREDMLGELREEVSLALQSKRRGRAFVADVTFEGFAIPSDTRGRICIKVRCKEDIAPLKRFHSPKDREKTLRDNRQILKHQSLLCLLVDGKIISFPSLNRDEDLIALNPPVLPLLLDLPSTEILISTILALKSGRAAKVVQIDTSVFAYEPVLKSLQQLGTDVTRIRLAPELLHFVTGYAIREPPSIVRTRDLLDRMELEPDLDLGREFSLNKRISLDDAQASSFMTSLSQTVSLIQGPPGTGKSFIGALLARALHDLTKHRILVVCYTNHALDQFLEDLLDINIPTDSITRLGGKSTGRIAQLSVYDKTNNAKYRLRQGDWSELNRLESDSRMIQDSLSLMLPKNYATASPSMSSVLRYLQLHDSRMFVAFSLPGPEDGMQLVGANGQPLPAEYLLDRWARGKNAGGLSGHPHVLAYADVWAIPGKTRWSRLGEWKEDMLASEAESLATLIGRHTAKQLQRDVIKAQSTVRAMADKRIIACTTTAAAKYRRDITAAAPTILLVEEAGEILESHLLSAIGTTVEQVILIGDHLQLRPKCDSYALTVEKGAGYDLNRSLFERLVLQDFPHHTLTLQHRMRPEISRFVRELTYPDLRDAPGTLNRPDIRGLQKNVIFIGHGHSEEGVDGNDEEDRRQKTRTNLYEANMVLAIVKYLGQQGYGTDKLVILTPYLGQLFCIRKLLSDSHDAVLNDLDAFDLVKAGLVSPAAAKLAKKQIRLATIDNYQGEESDIVIASLTRGNPNRDIGFMSAPERLNVLLSRARNGLIILGNGDTFGNPRKGTQVWKRFFELMRADQVISNGLPIKCERHPAAHRVLENVDDFAQFSPEGGCELPCTEKLSCGQHTCPSKCHQLVDHSKMICRQGVETTCPNGHRTYKECSVTTANPQCVRCTREAKKAQDQARRLADRQAKRDADQAKHDLEVQKIETEMALVLEDERDARQAEDRRRALEQKKKDLEEARARKAAPKPSATVLSSAASPVLASVSSFFGRNTASSSSVPSKSSPGSPAVPPSLGSTGHARPADSPAQLEWRRQKDCEGASNTHIDDLMGMVGLEKVKQQVLDFKAELEVAQRQGISLDRKNVNCAFTGNPGTGKTTVARLYAKFLSSIDVLPGTAFVEITGAKLAQDGIPGLEKILDTLSKAGGGTVFVDEAYQLTDAHNPGGRSVLDLLLTKMLDLVGQVLFIFAGYSKNMEAFFEANPGLPSRIPQVLRFDDYSDAELVHILASNIAKKWKNNMQVEDGPFGLYVRIAIRRLGSGRGRDGFGNARDVSNLLEKISQRQARRIAKERKEGKITSDLLLTAVDIIGPNPSEAQLTSSAYTKLQGLVGLQEVKNAVASQISRIQSNYERELREDKPVSTSLNRVFLGNPGTGKTTVAMLYGQILADLGVLSNGEVVLKNPADFVGDVVGASEKRTKDILASTRGKVLVIDEAYGLYEKGGNAAGFKTAVIDTIVAEVQSTPGEDRCVLLLGYREQMEQMFQNVNPGLSRRFAIEDAFTFADFSREDLARILDMKLADQDLHATDAAKKTALDMLERKRVRSHFGNAGEVENVISAAKNRFQAKQLHSPLASRARDIIFEPEDFDPNHARARSASANIAELFRGMVGVEEIVAQLRGYQETAERMKQRDMDYKAETPTTFVFKGPPGTGKTTVARMIGQVYYDMGFLASAEVDECSASHLMGKYVGETGPLVRARFDKALGKVLFIDEAYRLAAGLYAQEAIDEMVDCLTKDKYKGNLIVILAGYEIDINRLLSVNRGLASRFPEELVFTNMSPEHALSLLVSLLAKQKIRLSLSSDDPLLDLFTKLAMLPSWANARDVETLARKLKALAIKNANDLDPAATLLVQESEAVDAMLTMLHGTHSRAANPTSPPMVRSFANRAQPPPPPSFPSLPPVKTSTKIQAASRPKPATQDVHFDSDSDMSSNGSIVKVRAAPERTNPSRDPGVADAVWKDLQRRKDEAARVQRELEELERREEETRKLEVAAREATRRAAIDDESARRAELLRIKALEERVKRAKEAARLAKMQEERKKEEAVQRKLRTMGVCEAGFQWIKTGGGYRCAGGTHFVTDAQLGV